MDLNYQNFTGQYNLPMQTLQNVGALTASLGPMAGGYGYAGGAQAPYGNYSPTGAMGGGNFANTGYNANAGLPGVYNNMGTSQQSARDVNKFNPQPNIGNSGMFNKFSPQAINPMIT